ncbi:hypothetical protein EWM64_g1682 [Hericium alpestre]|uniref:Uncharacterized protein n=1 Tax=Hericium alpestre TaxID=135208 RepID=A0A4Z0A9W0_9AGAM|nr:hypothetical protein EWM64_g1682 [Hericium alpestre]
MLPTPDDTPLGPIEASSPIAACTPRLSPAFDDPFVSGASPPATASPYLKALSTASPDLRAPRIQRPNDVGSRIPRPMSLTAIPLHVVDSPLRVPDTPVPSGLDTPRVLVHASDKVSVSLSPLVSNVSASKDYSCDIAQSVGSPVAEANGKAKLDTLADSKQTAGPLSLSSPVLNAATASARPVRPAQANEKRKSCPPRASTRPAIDRSSTIAPARQISRASSLRIVPPVSSQPKPTRVTSSYYQKENHRKPELGNAGKSKPSPPTCRSPQTAPAALEKTRIQPLKRTSSVTSTRPVREGRAPTGPPPKGPATKRVTVCSTVNQAPIYNLIRTAKPVERARSIRGTKPAPPFPASSPAAIANAVPASLLATSSSGSIFPSVNNDVDLEAGDTVIEMQRQGVASGLPSDGEAGVEHTPRKSNGLRGFAKMVGEALSSPFKPAKASAPTRVWR